VMVLYSSPVAKQLDEEIDKIMWTSITLEINSILYPRFRKLNTKILNELYTAGGAVYSLTLIPELGIGYESRKNPLIFPKHTKLLLNINSKKKKQTRKKTKRN